MLLNSRSLIDKLVRKNLSFLRITSFCLFAIVGFFILLLASTIYMDYAKDFGKESGLWKTNFVVLNKKISSLQSITGEKSTFDQSEIDELSKQAFVEELGVFKSSQFPVKLQLGNIGGMRGFTTDLFLESVPENFIEVENSAWQWTTDTQYIPIILPKSYLNLYNFGFASTQGLPQLSENLFTKIPFQLVLGKGENQQVYPAKIVDFTTKINTILVPPAFLDWANEELAAKTTVEPSRVLLNTRMDPDADMLHYFEDKNYDVNKDELKNNELTYYLQLAFSGVLLIGLLIVGAALWLILINFQLMIEKNKKKTKDLFLMGYTLTQLSRPYIKYACLFLVLSYLAAIPLLFISDSFLQEKLQRFIFVEQSQWIRMSCYGIGLVLLLILINTLFIRTSIKSIITHKKRAS